jgi:hypothetical protein
LALSIRNRGQTNLLTLRSALRAGVLSSCFAKKKVAKEEGDPRVGAGFAGSLRYSKPAGAAELGLRPQTVLALYPPLSALLSASHGDPKGVSEQRLCPSKKSSVFCGRPQDFAQNRLHRFSVDASPIPLEGAEQRRSAGGFRRALFEGQRPELRSRPAFRVAQGTRAAGTDPGSPFLCLLSFGEAKESKAPRKGETQRQTRWNAAKNRNGARGHPIPPPRHKANFPHMALNCAFPFPRGVHP